MVNLAIFASGSGSNAEEIIKHFKRRVDIQVKLVLTNNAHAYVVERARKHKVDCKVFSRTDFYETDEVLDILHEHDIHFIVLAGFLWLIPKKLISKFPDRIINIHPALLPNYGGKGMYGANVHNAVLQAGDKETGITIHYVNDNYDEGGIIFQEKCPVNEGDTATSIQERVHELEHKHFPSIIEKTVRKTFRI